VRRSGRISKEVPILLIGTDLDGDVFSEPTHTVLLSLHGAGIVSKHKLSPEQELVLRWPERDREVEIRVVGQIGVGSGRFTYGVAFLDSPENFWEATYPPLSPAEQEFGVLSLVCNGCQATEKIDDASIEVDVCATNDGLVRYCQHCGCSTVWKLAQPGAQAVAQGRAATPALASRTPARRGSAYSSELFPSDPERAGAYSSAPPEGLSGSHLRASAMTAAPGSTQASGQTSDSPSAAPPSPEISVHALPSPAAKSSAPLANRRKHPRVKVNYTALVRLYGQNEDIVHCEDISRGGLRFRSRIKYFLDALVEVAAPYSSGQPAIFMPAQIIFVHELPEQKLFRYGVSFRKPVPSHDRF